VNNERGVEVGAKASSLVRYLCSSVGQSGAEKGDKRNKGTSIDVTLENPVTERTSIKGAKAYFWSTRNQGGAAPGQDNRRDLGGG